MNIEVLRAFCTQLPAVTEDVKWGADLCFSIGGKMFCVGSMESESCGVSFKADDAVFEELTLSGYCIPAPYLARYKWVQVQRWDLFTEAEWEQYITGSYDLIKAKLPKKLLKELAISEQK